jgi:hypothetical protein
MSDKYRPFSCKVGRAWSKAGRYFPQQRLNFLPEAQGQASLRPTFGSARTTGCCGV